MIGIGTDIVSISRIRRLHDRYGMRFAHKILSQDELVEYPDKKQIIHFLAKRFTAKEALVKALGTGFSMGISFADITVYHDALGKPELRLTGVVQDISRKKGVKKIHLSISDEKDYAQAFVICE